MATIVAAIVLFAHLTGIALGMAIESDKKVAASMPPRAVATWRQRRVLRRNRADLRMSLSRWKHL